MADEKKIFHNQKTVEAKGEFKILGLCSMERMLTKMRAAAEQNKYMVHLKLLLLYEKGDLNYISRHPDFRIIAYINPANDSGKKPLPPHLMKKFTMTSLTEPTRLGWT